MTLLPEKHCPAKVLCNIDYSLSVPDVRLHCIKETDVYSTDFPVTEFSVIGRLLSHLPCRVAQESPALLLSSIHLQCCMAGKGCIPNRYVLVDLGSCMGWLAGPLFCHNLEFLVC